MCFGRVTGGGRTTECRMICWRPKVTGMDVNSPTFAPRDCVPAYESRCFANGVGAKVGDFCTSIDFSEARQNSQQEEQRVAWAEKGLCNKEGTSPPITQHVGGHLERSRTDLPPKRGASCRRFRGRQRPVRRGLASTVGGGCRCCWPAVSDRAATIPTLRHRSHNHAVKMQVCGSTWWHLPRVKRRAAVEYRRPGDLRETHGFASPSRDGFALSSRKA